MSLASRGRPYAKAASAAFAYVCALCAFASVAILVVLLWQMCRFAWGWLDWQFLTSFDSLLSPQKAGVKAALVGSLYLISLTALFSVPVGVGAAVYLEEYAQRSRWRGFVQTNIANLAGVPSIVYGILGLGLFVRGMKLGAGVLAGALTLSLVVLPIVILASQEALRAVPASIRQASFALGATKWQTIWHQLLPAAMPGIMTGVILAISRALGEAAPLVAIGAAGFVMFLPAGVNDRFTALPLQIYNWTENADEQYQFHVAAAGIIVLLAMLICLNAAAVYLRYRFGRRIRW
ncbi:MAG: phosphate ABC transporter permease PtsA [Planctomycetota bacterium]|nr:MAG: phosphate ABC transporter permease PtsA [Planctomycetota bacterium]